MSNGGCVFMVETADAMHVAKLMIFLLLLFALYRLVEVFLLFSFLFFYFFC